MAITFFACSKSPSPIGADLLKNDLIQVKTLDSYKDSLNQKSSYLVRTVPLGASYYLMLGKKNNVESSILLQFLASLPDSIITDYQNNQLSVVSAKVTLTKYYVYGDSNSVLDFTVNKVNSSWNSGTVTRDSIAAMSIDASDISSNKNITDSTTTFYIDPQVALSWIQGSVDTNASLNYGIYIQPTSTSQKVIGYESLNFTTGYYPYATVVVKLNGTTLDTLTFGTAQDASISNGTLPALPGDDIAVQGGLVINSKLWFDVKSIPQNAIINSATLTLTGDSLNTVTGSNYTNSISVICLVDSTLLDSTKLASATLVGSNNVFSGDISSFVQSWVRSGNNQGMLLSDYNQTSGFELFALKGSNASNLVLRPRLQITYTTKK